MDNLTPEQRGRQMSLVKSKGTKPEMVVRRLIHGMGYRYRLHIKDLPGCPDIVFRKKKKVIFVHGCFWHRHANCVLARIPKSNVAFWSNKLESNRMRDGKNQERIQELGWRFLIVWECELKNMEALENKIRRFLDDEG